MNSTPGGPGGKGGPLLGIGLHGLLLAFPSAQVLAGTLVGCLVSCIVLSYRRKVDQYTAASCCKYIPQYTMYHSTQCSTVHWEAMHPE